MQRLNGKIALVTGAAQGIGEAIAERFAQEGAFVVVTDIQDELGASVAQRHPGQTIYRRLDVRNEADWITVIDDILRQRGKLDIVVNNAGVTGFHEDLGPQDPEHASLESWRKVHSTNLEGVFLGCKHGIRAMRPAKSGVIINISSRSGQVGIPGAAAYASSKGAVRNHSKTVALYCAEQGLNIRCNSVHPAAILTPMWDHLLGHDDQREARVAMFTSDIPLRRFGLPREVADACLFLASDEAAYVTGIEFVIDGGILAGASAAPGKKDE